MARPRKNQDERRSETLGIRLSPAERFEVEQATLAAGLIASEYARAQVLGGRVVIRQSRALDHAVFDELRRIGVNLNQLTRLAHQREHFPAGLSDACAALERLLVRELVTGAEAPACQSAGEDMSGEARGAHPDGP